MVQKTPDLLCLEGWTKGKTVVGMKKKKKANWRTNDVGPWLWKQVWNIGTGV